MKVHLILPILVLLGSSAALVGCTSHFIVRSEPNEAEIFFENPVTNERKSIGKTPIDIKGNELKDMIGSDLAAGEFYNITVEKKDFQTARLMIPATRFGTLVSLIDLKLKQGPYTEKTAREVLNQIFLVQKLALTKQYDRAQAELDKILLQYPEFPRAYSMRASIFYMQRNYPESLKWYEQAIKYDPQMEEAIQMMAKIRAIQARGRVVDLNQRKAP